MTQLNVSEWTALSLLQAQQKRKQQLSTRAMAVETGGYTYNTLTLDTSERMQAKINAAYNLAQADSTISIDLPLVDGTFHTFTAADILTVAPLIAKFIVACANNESAISQQIDACATVADVKTVSITSGWPANHN